MTAIILSMLMLAPLYGVLIWSYFNPKESLLWGKRGMFKEEPELTDAAIHQAKVTAIIGMFLLTFIIALFVFAQIIY